MTERSKRATDFEAKIGGIEDGKQVVEALVEAVKPLIEEMNSQPEGKVRASLRDFTGIYEVEMDGWVLFVSQLDEEFEKDREEGEPSYYETVVKIEISELELNGGKPKWSLFVYYDEFGDLRSNSFGRGLSTDPVEVVSYLESVLERGKAVPRILGENLLEGNRW